MHGFPFGYGWSSFLETPTSVIPKSLGMKVTVWWHDVYHGGLILYKSAEIGFCLKLKIWWMVVVNGLNMTCKFSMLPTRIVKVTNMISTSCHPRVSMVYGCRKTLALNPWQPVFLIQCDIPNKTVTWVSPSNISRICGWQEEAKQRTRPHGKGFTTLAASKPLHGFIWMSSLRLSIIPNGMENPRWWECFKATKTSVSSRFDFDLSSGKLKLQEGIQSSLLGHNIYIYIALGAQYIPIIYI